MPETVLKDALRFYLLATPAAQVFNYGNSSWCSDYDPFDLLVSVVDLLHMRN